MYNLVLNKPVALANTLGRQMTTSHLMTSYLITSSLRHFLIRNSLELTSGQWRLKRFDYIHEDSRNNCLQIIVNPFSIYKTFPEIHEHQNIKLAEKHDKEKQDKIQDNNPFQTMAAIV